MPSRDRRSRVIPAAVLGLVTSLAGLGVVSSAVPASADGAIDPFAATAYQENPAHDGGYTDAGFTTPLHKSWSVDLGGDVGYPVINDGVVYVSVGASQEVDVEALSLVTGDVVWGPKALSSKYGEGSLAYDDGQVFALSANGQMTAFDAATGAKNWVQQMPGQSDFSSPPTAADGTVYAAGAGVGGTLYAVDEATGDVKWTGSVENGDDSAPAVGDGGVFVSYACNQAYRFDTDGELAWHYTTDCEGGGGATTALHAGKLYTRDFEGDLVLDDATGHLVDTYASGSIPAFDGDRMATMSDGVLSVWNNATGDRVWKGTVSDNVTAPVFANHDIVEVRSNGTVELRDEKDGSLVWAGTAGTGTSDVDLDTNQIVGPAVGDHTLVVPTDTSLTAFAPGDGGDGGDGGSEVSIVSGPAQDEVVGSHVTFAFTSDALDPQYDCTLDGVSSPCTSPVTYTGLSDGAHWFQVTLDGTSISSDTRSFTVDSDSHTIWIEGPTQDQLVGRYALFMFGSDVPNATYSCSLNHGPAKPCSPPEVSYGGLHSGPHTFTISMDGFPSSTTTREFTSYDDGPVVRLARIRPTVTHQPKVTVHWSATDPFGVAFSQLRVKRAAHGQHMPGWTKLDKKAITSARLSVPRGGRLCVAVRALDRASEWSHWTSPQCVVRAARHH